MAARLEPAPRPRATLALVFGAASAVFAIQVALRPLEDNSFLTHLATGRLILDDGIPRSDPFSATAQGVEWVVQSWLPATLYAGLERAGGTGMLRAGFALQLGVLAVLVWRLTRPAETVVPRVGAAALALAVGSIGWSERPLLIGLIGLGVSLLAAESARWPWWLVPTYWVWANSHGSFPLGLVLLAILAAGSRLDGDDARPALRALVAAGGGTVLAMLNPLGPKLLVFPIHLLRRHDVLSFITEWQAPEFTSGWERVFLVQVLVAVLALVRRPSWRDGLTVAFALGLSLLALRNVMVGSMLLVPVTARGFGGLGALRSNDTSRAARLALVAVTALGVLVTTAGLQGDDYDLDAYPVRALAWLRASDTGPGDELVVAPDYVGNYLEAVYGPDARVYIDDRYDMYPEALARDYVALLRAQPGWNEALDRQGAQLVVWETEQPLTQLLDVSAGWRAVYRDERWAVFCRRGAAGACAR